MAEYRLDVMIDASCDVQAQEFFAAETNLAAIEQARELMRQRSADPLSEYGNLWAPDATLGEVLYQIEVW